MRTTNVLALFAFGLTASAMNEAELSSASSSLYSLATKLSAYATESGYASMEKDYSSWHVSYTATQTAIPTGAVPDTVEGQLEVFAELSIDLMEGQLEVLNKKQYMDEEVQKAYVKDVEEFIEGSKSVLAVAMDMVGAAGRTVTGTGVGAVVLAVGLAVVAVL